MEDFDTKKIAAELTPIIEEAMKTVKIENEESLKAFKEELTALKAQRVQMAAEKGIDEKTKQAIMVATFKSVAGQSQVTEAQFKEAFEVASKAAFNNEGIAGEGAELVFTQFAEDVLHVMKKYPVVGELDIFEIRGTELKIPRGSNTISTAWVGEGVAIGKSKLGTAFLTINTAKAACLVPFTEELLKDNMTVPKYYEMVVKFIGESQGLFMENEVLNGVTANVEGLLVNASVGVAALPATVTTLRAATAAQLDDLLVNTDSLIAPEYEINGDKACAVMSKYVFNIYRRAKTTTGAYMYPELREKNPTLLGKYRILISPKAPMQNQAADIAGATAFLIGEINTWFAVAMTEDLTLTRGFADGDFEADLQSVKARRRFGGKVKFGEAFAKAKTAAA